MNLNLNSFTPSNLYALNDTITPYKILKIVVDQYLKSDRARPDIDPYLSPVIADMKFFRA